MASAPNSGPVPSSSRTTSSPHPAKGLQGPLFSHPVQTQGVASEQRLLRSDTVESNTSTATTLVNSDLSGNIQLSPCTPTCANTRFSSTLSIHSEVDEPETYDAQSPGSIPVTSVLPPALPAAKDALHGNDNTSPQNGTRAEPIPPFTISWIKSLLTNIPRKNLIKNLISLAGCICGIVSTLTYTYRSYKISLWQAEQTFYDHCKEWAARPSDPGFDICNVILKEPLRQPPYLRPAITVKHVNRDLSKTLPAWSLWTRDRDYFFVYFIVLLELLFIAYVIIVFCRCRCRRKATQAWHAGQPWDSNGFWPSSQQSHRSSDAYLPVNVRIAPLGGSAGIEDFNATTSRGWTSTAPEENHLVNISHKRRLISVMPESLGDNIYTASIRPLSLEPVEKAFGRAPGIHSNDLKTIPGPSALTQDDPATRDEVQKVLTRTKRRRLTQVGDALKGRCDDERILPISHAGDLFSFLRRKVNSKCRKSPYLLGYDVSTDEPESSWAALEADAGDIPKDRKANDEAMRQANRKNQPLSGFVALGMGQSGAALASLLGGAISQRGLLLAMDTKDGKSRPTSPQTWSRRSTQKLN